MMMNTMAMNGMIKTYHRSHVMSSLLILETINSFNL